MLGEPITITANHSNYLVCIRANTQSVTVRKSVKTATQYCHYPHQLKVISPRRNLFGGAGSFRCYTFN